MNRRRRGEDRELRSLHTTVNSFNHHNTTLTDMPDVNTTEMTTESVSWAQQREAEADLQVPDQHSPGDVADKPTLAKSQVSSVRKHLKIQLLTLLRHPTAEE